MELRINGTVNIEAAGAVETAEEAKAEQKKDASTPIDHSKDVLISNDATFGDLMRVLAKNPEVKITARFEAEEHKREEKEQKLREIYGDEYDLIFGDESTVRARGRRPGAVQLRNTCPRVAMMELEGGGRIETYYSGFSVYDNGDRRVVLWTPDCAKTTYYFSAMKDGEKSYMPQKSEISEDTMSQCPWYIPIIVAGEDRIEYGMDHPKSKETTSDFNSEDFVEKPSYHWVGCSHIDTPEEAFFKKEAAEERRRLLQGQKGIVYHLYYEEYRTQDEIAEIMGITRPTVQQYLRRIEVQLGKHKEEVF